MKSTTIALLLVLPLAGCSLSSGINISEATATQVAAKTTISKSKFDAATTITGPSVRVPIPGPQSTLAKIFAPISGHVDWKLAALVAKMKTEYMVVIKAHYTDYNWHFDRGVSLVGGKVIPSDGAPNRQVYGCYGGTGTCDYGEAMLIPLPLSMLKTYGQNDKDIVMRVNNSTNREPTIRITANYINGFLNAVNSHIKSEK